MRTTSRVRLLLAAIGFLIVGAFLLTTEHRAHLFGVLPYLLLLACPLLHLFAHGGHGNHGAHDRQTRHDPAGGSPAAYDAHASRAAWRDDAP